MHRLDLVIADRPMPPELNVRGYNHLLGASDVTVFGTEAVARTLKGKFPALLDNAPLLLPGEGVALRPRLLQWLEAQDLRPRVVGEFDDSGLMKAFGQGGAGLFVAPTAIAGDVCRQYGVRALGRIEAVAEQLYAITTERRLQHPATVAISEAAQRDVFAVHAIRDEAAARPAPPSRRTFSAVESGALPATGAALRRGRRARRDAAARQRVAQQELGLRVDAAQLLPREPLQLDPDARVDPEEKCLLAGHLQRRVLPGNPEAARRSVQGIDGRREPSGARGSGRLCLASSQQRRGEAQREAEREPEGAVADHDAERHAGADAPGDAPASAATDERVHAASPWRRVMAQ